MRKNTDDTEKTAKELAEQRARKVTGKRNGKRQRRHSGPRRLTYIPDFGDDQALTIPEWSALNGFSVHTGWRIIHGPNPPDITQLSANRLGVTRRANRAWQESRKIGGDV